MSCHYLKSFWTLNASFCHNNIKEQLSQFITYERPLRKHLACSRDRTNISGLCSDEEIFERRLMHRENSTNAAWVIVKCARLILIYLRRRLENEAKRHTLDDRGTLEWYCGLDMHQSCYLWILIFRFWIPFHFTSALGPLLDFEDVYVHVKICTTLIFVTDYFP